MADSSDVMSSDVMGNEQSSRHPADAFSLVMGLLFMALAGLYLVHDLSGPDVDLRWVGPAALIAIGRAGLVASVRRRPGS